MEERRVIPRLTDGDYVADSCGVCGIYDIMGTPPEECVLHYSAPNVEYNYGYDYITVSYNGNVQGYYIGTDRFCKLSDCWGKEYALYEYAIFDEHETERVNALLFRHLTELARITGCSRIICRRDAENSPFSDVPQENLQNDSSEFLALPVPGAKISPRDAIILPKSDDALGFEELFFLREQGFVLDEEKCLFKMHGEYISIDRKTGACKLSKAFSIIGGELPPLTDRTSLYLVDICRQLLSMNYRENVTILLKDAKSDEMTPDVLVDNIGIFLFKDNMTMKENRDFRMKLRQDGKLQKYARYRFHFDIEVGGEVNSLAFYVI